MLNFAFERFCLKTSPNSRSTKMRELFYSSTANRIDLLQQHGSKVLSIVIYNGGLFTTVGGLHYTCARKPTKLSSTSTSSKFLIVGAVVRSSSFNLFSTVQACHVKLL